MNNLTITSEIQNESFYDQADLDQSVILQDANSYQLTSKRIN
jgi:hypothetical protein